MRRDICDICSTTTREDPKPVLCSTCDPVERRWREYRDDVLMVTTEELDKTKREWMQTNGLPEGRLPGPGKTAGPAPSQPAEASVHTQDQAIINEG